MAIEFKVTFEPIKKKERRMEWIVVRNRGFTVDVRCPKCHELFFFRSARVWKCCPLCETKMSGIKFNKIRKEQANDTEEEG